MRYLTVQNLSKAFGGLLAVDDLSFEVDSGDILGLIGPNGSGKTTTFNVLTGFYPASSGQVLFKGKSILGLKPHQILKQGVVRTFDDFVCSKIR